MPIKLFCCGRITCSGGTMKKNQIPFFILTYIFLMIVSNDVCGEDFSVSLNKDINYYIQTEDGFILGHDWETDEDFNEIRSAEVSNSGDKTVISLPSNNNYLFWCDNTKDNLEPFNVDMQTPHSSISLMKVFSSYDYPQVVYTPVLVDESDGSKIEMFNLLSFPNTIPQIIFEPEINQGECQIVINSNLNSETNNNEFVKIPIQYIMYHAYEYGEVDIWLTAIDDNDKGKFNNLQFDLDILISCTDENNMTRLATTPVPLPLQGEGYFRFFYQDMFEGSTGFFNADLDGNDQYEIKSSEGYFDIQETDLTSFDPTLYEGMKSEQDTIEVEEGQNQILTQKFTMPDGIRYTIPDAYDAFIFANATNKEIIKNGLGKAGDFSIKGNIYNDGEKNGFPAYYVEDNDIVFSFFANEDFIKSMEKQGWKPSSDIATSINGDKIIFAGEENFFYTGALIFQASSDGKKWITYDITIDWLGNLDSGNYYEISPMQLDTGCFYRVIFAYELKKEKEEKKFLGSKYDYINYAEVYQFYIYNKEAVKETQINQQYSLGTKVKTGDNFFGTQVIDLKDKHYGWDIGNFFITGYTEHQEINGNHVFLKNVGDEITLWFNLQQDINALNGDQKIKIKSDKNITDQYFELPKTNFYRGALIIRYTDYQNKTHDPILYVNFLEANVFPFANTKVQLFEEGDYEVALDYSIDKNHYRIAFDYSIRNSNCMVYPFDVVTKSEMGNSSFSENGFYLDLARSRYLEINVKRVVMLNGAEDVRFNRSARDGEQYTDEGIYIITVKNKVTGEQTEKRIYVGADYKQYSQN